MDTKVIAFAGKKQSGKSSAANFLAGYILTQAKRKEDWLPLPKTFQIDDNGQLIIDTKIVNENGVEECRNGILDLRNKDVRFIDFAEKFIWPYVKIYSFADSLKEVAGRLFGLTYEQLYGSDEQKNSLIGIKWNQMAKMVDNRYLKIIRAQKRMNKNMTAREFLQFFGTNICRTLYDNCWIDDTVRRIIYDNYPFAIIDDCRFTNEVIAIKDQLNGRVIKLTRELEGSVDEHQSENDLIYADFTHQGTIINNRDLDIREKNQAILDYVYNRGLLDEYIELKDNTR